MSNAWVRFRFRLGTYCIFQAGFVYWEHCHNSLLFLPFGSPADGIKLLYKFIIINNNRIIIVLLLIIASYEDIQSHKVFPPYHVFISTILIPKEITNRAIKNSIL